MLPGLTGSERNGANRILLTRVGETKHCLIRTKQKVKAIEREREKESINQSYYFLNSLRCMTGNHNAGGICQFARGDILHPDL